MLWRRNKSVEKECALYLELISVQNDIFHYYLLVCYFMVKHKYAIL